MSSPLTNTTIAASTDASSLASTTVWSASSSAGLGGGSSSVRGGAVLSPTSRVLSPSAAQLHRMPHTGGPAYPILSSPAWTGAAPPFGLAAVAALADAGGGGSLPLLPHPCALLLPSLACLRSQARRAPHTTLLCAHASSSGALVRVVFLAAAWLLPVPSAESSRVRPLAFKTAPLRRRCG